MDTFVAIVGLILSFPGYKMFKKVLDLFRTPSEQLKLEYGSTPISRMFANGILWFFTWMIITGG